MCESLFKRFSFWLTILSPNMINENNINYFIKNWRKQLKKDILFFTYITGM